MTSVLRATAQTFFFALLALAQTEPPKVPAPTPTPSPTPSLRKTVDALPDGDAQQALELLRSKYVRSGALDEPALARATLQGLLERLGGGASVRPSATPLPVISPLRSEILDERIGYVRLGSLTRGHIAELDAALGNFKSKKIGALVLDLRATPPSSDFELAAEVIKRLTPKGKMLFAVHRPSLKQEQMFTSDLDPAFHGVIVTLIHRETAGAPEVIAAVLRTTLNALTIGQTTAGQAAEFADFPLRGGGKVLHVAVAEVKQELPIFPDGLKPDLPVDFSPKEEEEVLKAELEKGVGGLVFETERPRLNEAALVAGTNPEIDAREAEQASSSEGAGEVKPMLYDAPLQRAVDLVTALSIFGGKAP
jgi:hypothetical protein